MLQRKFFLLTIIIWSTLIYTGCSPFGSDTASEQNANTQQIEAQAVSEAPPTFTPIPTEQPASELKTELPAEPISPISPVSPVTKAVESTMTDTVKAIAGSEEALTAAKEDLSNQTGVPLEEIRLVSIEAVEWSDTSLGCPQEGYMYAQVITPGYKIILESQGQRYEYHTDQKANVVLCQQ